MGNEVHFNATPNQMKCSLPFKHIFNIWTVFIRINVNLYFNSLTYLSFIYSSEIMSKKNKFSTSSPPINYSLSKFPKDITVELVSSEGCLSWFELYMTWLGHHALERVLEFFPASSSALVCYPLRWVQRLPPSAEKAAGCHSNGPTSSPINILSAICSRS